MPAFFITGTDTGVGKTWFTCHLLRSWLARGRTAAAVKPLATGDRRDAELLREAGGNTLSLDEINPLHFREPAAPLAAAQAENRVIDFPALNLHIGKLRDRYTHFAVEGVGGWRVPLGPRYEVRHWARDLGLPVVVVARAGLGTLNHTLLTVDSIRDAGLTCAGVVVNPGPKASPASGAGSPDFDLARRTNVLFLRDVLLLPVLELDRRAEAAGEIPVWLGGE
jgi:dethiobiotin synthetase